MAFVFFKVDVIFFQGLAYPLTKRQADVTICAFSFFEVDVVFVPVEPGLAALGPV